MLRTANDQPTLWDAILPSGLLVLPIELRPVMRCSDDPAFLDRRRWSTREDLQIAIITWIERTYHRRRRQAALGRLTPIEFEAIMTTPASQAA